MIKSRVVTMKFVKTQPAICLIVLIVVKYKIVLTVIKDPVFATIAAIMVIVIVLDDTVACVKTASKSTAVGEATVVFFKEGFRMNLKREKTNNYRVDEGPCRSTVAFWLVLLCL